MKKLIRIILINSFIIIFLLFSIEISIWLIENENLKKIKDEYRLSNGMFKFHPGIKNFTFDPKFFPTPENKWGRAPEGLQFKSKPIVVFGCSYAYGYRLNTEQTFTYKLANLAKRPVYNRALPGWGIQHMLYQSKLDEIYEQIPYPEYVIYVFMNDHLRRMYLVTFMANHMLNEDFNLRYKEKNGKLIEIKNVNPFFNFFKRLYLTNELHFLYVKYIILRKANSENVYNFALKHFIESKEEMRKHWPDSKYVIFFYNDLYSKNQLKKQLEDEGFIVIGNDDLSDENLSDKKYLSNDYHPTEAAWNLITPLLIKKLNL